MDIPDTAFWCVPRASIWVATRNSGTATAELFGNGIGPWMNADNWLEEHKDELLPPYQGQFRANAPELARSPLDLASDEIIRAIRNDRLTLYDGDGDQIPETMLSRFLHVFEIRDWIEEERLCLQAKAVVTLWPQTVPAPAKRKRVSQQSVAEEVGREIFPCGVPASMTTQQTCAAIAGKLETDHPHLAKIIRPKTLARAASRLPRAST